jgi:hypothetical protein
VPHQLHPAVVHPLPEERGEGEPEITHADWTTPSGGRVEKGEGPRGAKSQTALSSKRR